MSRALTVRVDAVEALRYRLPAQVYLRLLHTAAITGRVPELDPDTGKATGNARAIPPKLQIETAMHLLNKVMPDRTLSRLETSPVVDRDALDDQNMRHIPTGQLIRVVDGSQGADSEDVDLTFEAG